MIGRIYVGGDQVTQLNLVLYTTIKWPYQPKHNPCLTDTGQVTNIVGTMSRAKCVTFGFQQGSIHNWPVQHNLRFGPICAIDRNGYPPLSWFFVNRYNALSFRTQMRRGHRRGRQSGQNGRRLAGWTRQHGQTARHVTLVQEV